MYWYTISWKAAERVRFLTRVARRIRILILVSTILSLVISILYILLAIAPLWDLRGYVNGYYSILWYKIYYAHSEQELLMPHTDYVKHVSFIFVSLSMLLLIISIISIVRARRDVFKTAGLAYGVACSLGALYGLFSGFLYRAARYDIESLYTLLGDYKTTTTSAGLIVFKGIELRSTLINKLLINTPFLVVLITIEIIASAIATALALIAMGSYKPRVITPSRGRGQASYISHLAIYTLTLIALASIFTYYPATIHIYPQPPTITLEYPEYTYTCTELSRTRREALAYTDFETYPVPGWTSYGGVWELSVDGGFKGNALRGRDNNGGVGRASSQYYWNTRIDGYTSLWVSLKVRAETTDGYKGIGLLNADRSRLYEISVQSTATIYKWDGAWRLLGSTSVPGYSATRWHTLVLYYTVTATAVNFALWIYNDTGALVATLTASDTGATRFTPAYAGVTVDAGTNLWFRFEDFVLSTEDPRSLYFTGFYEGLRVEVWDNLGYLVNSTTALAPSFTLGVVADVVVGTGSNGRILVRYPDAYLCGELTVPSTNAVLGGDTYALSTSPITLILGANKTSASLTLYLSGVSSFNTMARILRVNTSQLLYARLILDTYTSLATLNLDVWIEGVSTSTSISVRNGVPVETSTSIVQLRLGLGNTIDLRGYFTGQGQSATLSLKLELCTSSDGAGACVRYPVLIVVTS
ncbi:MAG: hypothetical protein QXE81_02020 [Desulfurococcaceae archaeon]